MKTIKVISAKPITSAYKSIIEDRFCWGQSQAVQFNYIIDPSIGSGVVIDDDGRRYDGTNLDKLNLINRSRTVKVISASKLTEGQKQRIENTFKKQQEPVNFIYSVDKTLIGGLKIIDGNEMYDGTLENRLSEIKKVLK